jgi:phospholipid/cholesterol/gamma-HCH transport system ATP-binding protein
LKIKKVENKTSTSEEIIILKNINKSFGGNVVLDDISLSFEKGKTTVIIGPSGCGKTVLIKHIIVLLRPDSGRVYFHDMRIDNMQEKQLDAIRTRMGFLFQGGALFDSLNVLENVIFPVKQHVKIKNSEKLHNLARTKLAMVGMENFENAFPAKLSGGQKKRVALARAIALSPEVILYDEPTTGLDPIRSDVINELILKLKRELGITSIVVTHDMASAYKIADRIVMLHDGKIAADGNADYIRSHSSPIVQQFINGQADDDDLKALRASSSDIKISDIEQ